MILWSNISTRKKKRCSNRDSGYEAHKVEHDKLVATCADLQQKFHAGEAEVTADTTQFVKDWLDNHIPKVDKDYGPFFNERGIS